jgi:ribosome modulation factor
VRLYYIAECIDCERMVMPFTDYEERATWVGKHRVATGHRVHMRMETK